MADPEISQNWWTAGVAALSVVATMLGKFCLDIFKQSGDQKMAGDTNAIAQFKEVNKSLQEQISDMQVRHNDSIKELTERHERAQAEGAAREKDCWDKHEANRAKALENERKLGQLEARLEGYDMAITRLTNKADKQ